MEGSIMNAAITTPLSTSATPTEAAAPTVPHDAPTGPRSFASFQAQSMTVCMLGVFVATALIHYGMQGGVAEAIGLAVYLAIWIGGGFGFLGGGVRWGLEYVEFDQAH